MWYTENEDEDGSPLNHLTELVAREEFIIDFMYSVIRVVILLRFLSIKVLGNGCYLVRMDTCEIGNFQNKLLKAVIPDNIGLVPKLL